MAPETCLMAPGHGMLLGTAPTPQAPLPASLWWSKGQGIAVGVAGCTVLLWLTTAAPPQALALHARLQPLTAPTLVHTPPRLGAVRPKPLGSQAQAQALHPSDGAAPAGVATPSSRPRGDAATQWGPWVVLVSGCMALAARYLVHGLRGAARPERLGLTGVAVVGDEDADPLSGRAAPTGRAPATARAARTRDSASQRRGVAPRRPRSARGPVAVLSRLRRARAALGRRGAAAPPTWAMAAIEADDYRPFDEDTLYANAYGPPDADGLSGSAPLHTDSIRWLPRWGDMPKEAVEVAPEGTMVLPLIPLGHEVILPGSLAQIALDEPRYRKMCREIVMNGSRRFVMSLMRPGPDAATDPGDSWVAEVGVVLYIEELRKMEDEDYMCECNAIQRVKIHRVVNPGDVGNKEEYVRAVVEELGPVGEGEDCREEEMQLSETFKDVCRLQVRVEPDESVLASVLEALKAQVELENELDAGKDAELDTEAVHKVLMEQGVENPLELLFGDKGLGCLYDGERDEVNLATEARFWETTIMWQLLLERRLETWKSRLLEAEKNMLGRFMDSPEIEELLEADLEEVQRRAGSQLKAGYKNLMAEFDEEATPVANLSLWFLQSLLQEPTHGRRVEMLQAALSRECMRLQAKAALKALSLSED